MRNSVIEAPIDNRADNEPSTQAQMLMGAAARLAAGRQLKPEQDFIRYALDSSAIVAVTDVRGTITYVNRKFCEISGYHQAELIGSNHRMLKSGTHDTAFFKNMYRHIARGKIWQGEICNRRKDGSFYWVYTTIVPHISKSGKVDSYTAIRFDITPRKQLEVDLRNSREHLKQIAEIDPLTDLPNRRCFQQHLKLLVEQSAHTGSSFHLGLMDIDAFKEINDSFGHDSGDQLLQAVATRLEGLRRDDLFVSRLGGDEFGIILANSTPCKADIVFEEVVNAVRAPIEIGSTHRRCSASIGVAVFPGDGEDSENVFKAADLALYHAKELGRDRLEYFQPRLRDVAESRSQALLEIEEGLRQNAFELHYQPVIHSAYPESTSVEALMRWRHPQQGLLMPGSFQEAFTDPALRATLGLYMLECVFRDVEKLCRDRVRIRRVGINLTNSDFRSDMFIDRFIELSKQTGISPKQFCVEVTEGILLGPNQRRVVQGLRRLHGMGVEVALDDFGTGYASLTHLRQLPFDRLKIDRSFVANMVDSLEDRAIIRGIIDIAHSIGKRVTAEGVETIEQVDMLTRMKCDQFQGWYFGKACPPSQLRQVLRSLASAGVIQCKPAPPLWPMEALQESKALLELLR